MKFLDSKILAVLLSALCVWMIFSIVSLKIERGETDKEEKNVEAKIINVRLDNKLLEKYIDNFKNPEFLEKEARLRLNYKAAGEEVVFVYDDPSVPKASSAEEFSAARPSVYEKIWHWLLEAVR